MNSSNELNEQVSALQRQVFALLLALIVVSGTLTVYLYRQASLTRKDTDALQQQAGPVIAIFRQNPVSYTHLLSIFQRTGLPSALAKRLQSGNDRGNVDLDVSEVSLMEK